MEIAFVFINAALTWAAWFFIGRSSIYYKLIREYREALELIDKQQALIEAYRFKDKIKETEKENGEQD